MKKDKQDTTFHFITIEEIGEDITIEVTEEEHRRQLAAGVPEDEMLSVGLHKARRGGFRQRYPNLSLENIEVRITKDEKQISAKNENGKKAA